MSRSSKRRRANLKKEARAAQVKAQPTPLFTTPLVEKPLDTGSGFVTDSGKILGKTFEFDKQHAFLMAYAMLGGISQAAKAAGCNRTTHNKWLREDPAYPAKFAEAQQEANGRLEAEARRRAVHGMERMKFYKGKPIMVDGKPYIEREYSDSLLIRLLQAHMPDKYAERQKVETSGSMTILDPELQSGLIDLGNVHHEEESPTTPVNEEPESDGPSVSA